VRSLLQGPRSLPFSTERRRRANIECPLLSTVATKGRTLGKFLLVVVLAMTSIGAAPPSLQLIKTEYKDVSARLEPHTIDHRWIDDDPDSRTLLSRQWSLAAEWAAAWLNDHPHQGADGVKAALAALDPQSTPDVLVLAPSTFLAISPTAIGNVFIVSKSNGGKYHVAWNIASLQSADVKSAQEIAAWQPENARDGDFSSGLIGSMMPFTLGILPSDAKGRPRFFIVADYAQTGGGTLAEEVSVWTWDGTTAILRLARSYLVGMEQGVGVRVEDDLLKIQKRQDFHTFYSCSSCKQRQVDWIVRVAPDSVKDVGEEAVDPELDTIDELFYRLINNKPAYDIANPQSIKAASAIVEGTRSSETPEEWKKFSSLGMLMSWSITGSARDKVVCLDIDGVNTDPGTMVFTLKQKSDGFYITRVKSTGTDQPCPKSKRSGP